MTRRRLALCLLLALAVAGAGAWSWFLNYSAESQASRHEKAKAAWVKIVRSGFKGFTPREVAEAFRDCFREGDVALDYAPIFATAERTEQPNTPTLVRYQWTWERNLSVEEGPDAELYFVVYVEDYRISMRYITYPLS